MRRGEVWLLNLDPTLGTEIKKTRPVVIVSQDSIGILPLRVIVPLTHWQERYAVAPWLVKIEPSTINCLLKTSGADTFQIRTFCCSRTICEKIGRVIGS